MQTRSGCGDVRADSGRHPVLRASAVFLRKTELMLAVALLAIAGRLVHQG